MQPKPHLSALTEAGGIPAPVTLKGHSTLGTSTVPSIPPHSLREFQTVRKILVTLEKNLPPSPTHPHIPCKTRM